MRQTTVILAVICLGGGLALADSLTINSIPYPNVRVTDAANGKIFYDFSGRGQEKPLGDVSYVELSGQAGFNKAEAALKAGKFAEAVAAYSEAEKAAGKPAWLGRLIRYRRLSAANAAKMPGQAVGDWLAIVDETGGSSAANALAPEAIAPKGSPENATAIRLLEQRLGDKGDANILTTTKALLLKLYQTEGLSDKAKVHQGGPSMAAPAGRTPGERPAAAALVVEAKGVSDKLQQNVTQVKAGQYDDAAAGIKSRLKSFSVAELPDALLLRGKALQLSFQKGGSKDAAKLKEAGLCFMRVASCFDASIAQAPEALYLGAMVEQALGNDVAAANALRLVVSRYETTEWARKAQAALGGPAEPGM